MSPSYVNIKCNMGGFELMTLRAPIDNDRSDELVVYIFGEHTVNTLSSHKTG